VPGADKAVEATRELSFLLAIPEKRLLRWISAKLPRWILPDDMTALGIASTMLLLLAGRAWRNLRELSRTEPAASRRG